MNAVVQVAEMVGASWVLWRLTQWCYRPRVPHDARDLERWPVETAESACLVGHRPDGRSGR